MNQLAIANKSLGGGTVVVMAERDKEEMELDIAKMEFDFKGTSVICRSGSPLILADLKKVHLNSHNTSFLEDLSHQTLSSLELLFFVMFCNSTWTWLVGDYCSLLFCYIYLLAFF